VYIPYTTNLWLTEDIGYILCQCICIALYLLDQIHVTPDFYGQEDQPHLSIAQGPALVACPWACQV